MNSVEINNPILPYCFNIPDNLLPGKMINVRGSFPKNMDVSSYSSINFLEGVNNVFHMSIRFNHRSVVRNTCKNDQWGTEEKGGSFPFALGSEFRLKIAVQQDEYHVSVNDRKCWTYAHRMPFQNVATLSIDGPVEISRVEYSSENNKGVRGLLPCTQCWEDAKNLSLGKAIIVKGAFPGTIDPYSYIQINLCADKTDVVALHISVRFNLRKVIRNTRRHGCWGKDESAGPFPFVLGSEFCMQIVVQFDAYHISVNGKHCWAFNHRMPFSNVTKLSVDGPLRILHIECINPNSMYQLGTYHQASGAVLGHAYNPDSQPSSCQPVSPLTQPIYSPSVPFKYIICGGIRPGMSVYVSGTPCPDFQRFTISLQCGSAPWPSPLPDVAFQFDVRFFSDTIVTNSRINNKWLNGEIVIPYFPFQPSNPFIMSIFIGHDKYIVAVNGKRFIEYKHRMTNFSAINTLYIINDISISWVKFGG